MLHASHEEGMHVPVFALMKEENWSMCPVVLNRSGPRRMWIRYVVLACLTGILGVSPVRAQMADRVEVEVGATTTSRATMPFWLHANTDGIVDPASPGGVLRGRVARSLRGRAEQTWAFGYGAEVVGRVSSRETLFLSALYAEARYGILRGRVGRKPETIGTVADSLASGSMGTSRNATPIPKILLRTDGYVDVPFTNEWLEFKGRFEHGWVQDRFVDGAFLHQKTLYLRSGDRSPVQVYGGLVHKAMWGGPIPTSETFPSRSVNLHGSFVQAQESTMLLLPIVCSFWAITSASSTLEHP
ncbi:MAG: hypothetical protein BRD43_06610 [Bacteroidetes bacterium QS_4_64_154]|nr:MAG: hypothetical protein BRD43_06610 [Bacteroidetes bacterium QS_4_64_154]